MIHALRAAFNHSVAYLEGLKNTPVDATVTAEALQKRFDVPLPLTGSDPLEVIDALVANVEGGLTASASGRFFGWVIGGALPAALAADWLTSTWDQVPGVYAVSPAGSIIEEVCGRWLKDLLNLPAEASFALVTGCQMAHVTCLAAARNALLARYGWDVEQRGLMGAPRIRVISGNLRHGTIERALRMLGLGINCIVDIQVDINGKLPAAALEAALAEDPELPAIVLLQAGNVNTGVFDPFSDLIPVAHKHNAWVHVDGAFGMWAVTSPAHRSLTTGMEAADSWATDGHKWLNVPYDCGYAFVLNSDAHRRAFSHKASYLHQSDTNRDAVDWTPEHSRRARGFATYAALKSLGRQGVGEMINSNCRHTRAIIDGVAALPNVRVVHYPIINQGLLRFLDPREGAAESDNNRRTDEMIAAIAATGEALFTGTTWEGQRCMRVSVSNWQTTDEDVQRAVNAISRCLAERK